VKAELIGMALGLGTTLICLGWTVIGIIDLFWWLR
jgi:hypothetical protein